MGTFRRTADADRGTGRGRRWRAGVLTGGVVAGAVLATLVQAPVAGAAETVFAHITDPLFPGRQARVSDDGRLGVGGDVGMYPAVPLGAWHETVLVHDLYLGRYSTPDGSYDWEFVHVTPPGLAMAISSASLHA